MFKALFALCLMVGLTRPVVADDLRTFAAKVDGVPYVTLSILKKAEGNGKKPKVLAEKKIERRQPIGGGMYFWFSVLSSHGPEIGQMCVTVGRDWVVETDGDFLDEDGRPSRRACQALSLNQAGGITYFSVTAKRK
jgi:hypothetical protein